MCLRSLRGDHCSLSSHTGLTLNSRRGYRRNSSTQNEGQTCNHSSIPLVSVANQCREKRRVDRTSCDKNVCLLFITVHLSILANERLMPHAPNRMAVAQIKAQTTRKFLNVGGYADFSPAAPRPGNVNMKGQGDSGTLELAGGVYTRPLIHCGISIPANHTMVWQPREIFRTTSRLQGDWRFDSRSVLSATKSLPYPETKVAPVPGDYGLKRHRQLQMMFPGVARTFSLTGRSPRVKSERYRDEHNDLSHPGSYSHDQSSIDPNLRREVLPDRTRALRCSVSSAR